MGAPGASLLGTWDSTDRARAAKWPILKLLINLRVPHPFRVFCGMGGISPISNIPIFKRIFRHMRCGSYT